MKAAKALAISLALVLAVFCLNAPMVWGVDEHPWDEEGGDQDNTGGLVPGGGSASPTQSTSTSTVIITPSWYIQVALWYYDQIGVYGVTIKIDEDTIQTGTSLTCKK